MKKFSFFFLSFFIISLMFVFSVVSHSASNSIKLDKVSLIMWTGDEKMLTASLSEELDGTTIKWESSNTRVAKVYGGKVSALSKGECTISATAEDGTTAICYVTVYYGAEIDDFVIYKTQYGTQYLDSKQSWQRAHQIDVSWSPLIVANYNDIDDYDLRTVVTFEITSDDGEKITAQCTPMYTGYSYLGRNLLMTVKSGREYTIKAKLKLYYIERNMMKTVATFDSNTLVYKLSDCGTYGMSFDEAYLAKEGTCATYPQYYKNCSICGVDYSKTVSHGSYTNNHILCNLVDFSDEKHIKVCGCGELSQTENHIFDQNVINENYKICEASCQSREKYFKSCLCGRKGDSIFENGEKLGHTFDEYISDENATCVSNGTKTAKCLNCNATDTIEDVDRIIPHSFGEYISNENATCIKSVAKTAMCKNCGAVDEIMVSGEHWFSDEFTIDKPSSCIEEGSKSRHCIYCGAKTDVVSIEKTKHTYNGIIKEPTCIKNGYTVYTCICGDSYLDDETYATGHIFNAEDKECQICDFNRTRDCSCNCHKEGLEKLLFKIILFFQKLFGQNKICECGVKH